MPADILVVTPSPSLGESIRRVLEETTLYRIHIVNNKASAVVRADEVGIPLAMLDLALGKEWVQEIGTALRTIHRGINLIVLCEDNIEPPLFDDLRPWILVHKPFTMTDFMTAISKPQSSPAPQPEEDNSAMPWLGDENKAAQHLTRLTLSSSAQAALITRKSDLWAYAGGLSHDAAKELALAVTRNWDGQKGSDLLRFIRLESTKAEHMLYATRLAADTVLALVFDAETPFSTIRNQASQLVSDLDKFELPKPSKPAPDITGEYSAMDEDNSKQENIPPITNILTDIPAPNPKREVDAPRKKPQKIQIDPNETRVSESLSDASVFNRESSPAIRLTPVARREPVKPIKNINVDFQSQPVLDNNVEVATPSRPQQRSATPISPPATESADMAVTRESVTKEKRTPSPVAAPTSSMDATRESLTTEAARKLTIEPVSAGLYHLTYACLLVPRFSTHYIAGDLAERLDEWLPNICIAFGWRLEFLAVRPDYLQWVVNVQPNTSPGYLMRIIRQQTSEKIFGEFPRFKKENTSTDFWAPGYLIMGGSQPHPPQLVKDYINQTRQRQGQEKSIPRL